MRQPPRISKSAVRSDEGSHVITLVFAPCLPGRDRQGAVYVSSYQCKRCGLAILFTWKVALSRVFCPPTVRLASWCCTVICQLLAAGRCSRCACCHRSKRC